MVEGNIVKNKIIEVREALDNETILKLNIAVSAFAGMPAQATVAMVPMSFAAEDFL